MWAERQAWLQKYVGEPQFAVQSRTQIGSWSNIGEPQYVQVWSGLGVVTVVAIQRYRRPRLVIVSPRGSRHTPAFPMEGVLVVLQFHVGKPPQIFTNGMNPGSCFHFDNAAEV